MDKLYIVRIDGRQVERVFTGDEHDIRTYAKLKYGGYTQEVMPALVVNVKPGYASKLVGLELTISDLAKQLSLIEDEINKLS